MKHLTHIIIAMSVIAIGSVQASVITKGSAIPTGTAIAENLDWTTGGTGGRQIQANAADAHTTGGQSFTATSSATAESISLRLQTGETFSTYDTASFELRLFSGVGGAATQLGSYSYDATGLGAGIVGDWLTFNLDSGVALTSGASYSFLITHGAEDAQHVTQFSRAKNNTAYTGGTDYYTATTYDWDNRASDPWDLSAPIGSSVITSNNGDLAFKVTAIPEPSSIALVALVGGSIIGLRRFFIL